MAHQKGNAQVLLKLADLHAKRGLRHVQLVGRPRHVAGFDNPDEILELAEIHSIVRPNFAREATWSQAPQR
jgi:hypothetical protein